MCIRGVKKLNFKIENVFVETELEQDYKIIKELISNAILFFENEFIVDTDKIHIIISSDYVTDVKKIHFQPETLNGGDENGMFIPCFFQNEENKKSNMPMIIINWNRLDKVNGSPKYREIIVESIIVHELVHYYDFCFTYPTSLIQRYGNVFENYDKGNFSDIIGGIFQNCSEVRAKFYQEKYILTSGIIDFNLDYMSKYISSYLCKINLSNRSQTYYTLAHIRGLLLCWSNLANLEKYHHKKDELQRYIMGVNQDILHKEMTNQYQNMSEVFELDMFYEYCDGIGGNETSCSDDRKTT